MISKFDSPHATRALDEVYRSFSAAGANPHAHDKDARHPEVIVNLAMHLNLLPTPTRTIKVTGSKGKGTTARFCADLLQQEVPSASVGLFVSPEEAHPFDRIRMNGTPIPESEFITSLERLKPFVQSTERTLRAGQYIAPLGYFLLIALDWYKRAGASYFVLECGRGAKWDQVGRLASEVSIVTSILFEHAEQIGPTLRDIADNKFFVASNSKHVVLSSQALPYMPSEAPMQTRIHVVEALQQASDSSDPVWILNDAALARRGVEQLLGSVARSTSAFPIRVASASYGRGVFQGKTYAFEAAINADSLDRKFLASLPRPLTILASLPDDKDRTRLLSELRSQGSVQEIALVGKHLNHLSYAEALACPNVIAIEQDDIEHFDRIWRAGVGFYYLVGTQSFIRLLHRFLRR